MPTVQNEGCAINYEISGPAGAPVLMLANSLGTNLHLWDRQVAVWERNWRVLRFDQRGHGKSGVPDGPYTIDLLGRDALAVMDALQLPKVHWCGLSMGGMIGQWLGANAPGRIDRLVLSNTHYHFADKQAWNNRIAAVREHGMGAIAEVTIGRWFSAGFHERSPQEVDRIRSMLLATPAEGYAGCCAAIRDLDLARGNASIAAPTLVIVGSQDPLTPPSAGEEIRRQIRGAELFTLDAGHIANIEHPDLYACTVQAFLAN